MINIVLPTGKLLEDSMILLEQAGLKGLCQWAGTRKLRITFAEQAISVLFVRPRDIPAYVYFGAAEVGIVGKDVLWESDYAVYELIDLGFGRCELVFAVPATSPLVGAKVWPPTLRVATKYTRAAERYFQTIGQSVELVSLHGSVELAPYAGLCDGIVDITQTGRTLAENNLVPIAKIDYSTARLVVNQASIRTKYNEVWQILDSIKAVLESGSDDKNS
jgi:ATP phosphoribosyltransferase